jgi:hypothetical protein
MEMHCAQERLFSFGSFHFERSRQQLLEGDCLKRAGTRAHRPDGPGASSTSFKR